MLFKHADDAGTVAGDNATERKLEQSESGDRFVVRAREPLLRSGDQSGPVHARDRRSRGGGGCDGAGCRPPAGWWIRWRRISERNGGLEVLARSSVAGVHTGSGDRACVSSEKGSPSGKQTTHL